MKVSSHTNQWEIELTEHRVGILRVLCALFAFLPIAAFVLRIIWPTSTFLWWVDRGFVGACHRIPERTFHWFGIAAPVCSRCMGVSLGASLGFTVPFQRSRRESRIWFAVSLVLMVIEIILQESGLHAPFHPTRFLSGMFVGLTVGWMLVMGMTTPPKRVGS
jgi:uncharacterized membrane protein